MKPFIDKSTNEKGEQEISIHGLSPLQFDDLQFWLKRIAKTDLYGKMADFHPNTATAFKTIKEFNPNA